MKRQPGGNALGSIESENREGQMPFISKFQSALESLLGSPAAEGGESRITGVGVDGFVKGKRIVTPGVGLVFDTGGGLEGGCEIARFDLMTIESARQAAMFFRMKPPAVLAARRIQQVLPCLGERLRRRTPARGKLKPMTAPACCCPVLSFNAIHRENARASLSLRSAASTSSPPARTTLPIGMRRLARVRPRGAFLSRRGLRRPGPAPIVPGPRGRRGPWPRTRSKGRRDPPRGRRARRAGGRALPRPRDGSRTK